MRFHWSIKAATVKQTGHVNKENTSPTFYSLFWQRQYIQLKWNANLQARKRLLTFTRPTAQWWTDQWRHMIQPTVAELTHCRGTVPALGRLLDFRKKCFFSTSDFLLCSSCTAGAVILRVRGRGGWLHEPQHPPPLPVRWKDTAVTWP